MALSTITIFVNNRHDTWSEKLLAIRFPLNTSKCSSTGKIAAFLNFGRKLLTIYDNTNDFHGIIANDNLVFEMNPYLNKLEKFTSEAKEVLQEQQDKRKSFADQKRRSALSYTSGDLVLVYQTESKQEECWCYV
ncbi:uncharacterized protein NPIL_459011 [Nephila pilipes]|uniref:Uncharacterized protein n=1 Tax=Nephila pilipes TaxID=299642 RepID=A0A8X6PJR2_NEPPI|nr:uncharacterized protein NPIL_459011 [Nephila pilipes]